jgi:hypothetical protein
MKTAHTANLYRFDGSWSGSVTVSDRVWNASTKRFDQVPGTKSEYTPITHVGPLSWAFTNVDGATITVDFSTIRKELNELWNQVEAVPSSTPTLSGIEIGSVKQDQWQSDESVTLSVAGLMLRIFPILYRETGSSEKRQQKYLISLWKPRVRGEDEGSRL